MNYNNQLIIYLKQISIEFLVILILCSLCIVFLCLCPKYGWINTKTSRIIAALVIVIFILFSICYFIDVFQISKDLTKSDYVSEKIIFNSEQKYNLGTIDLYSKKYIFFNLEDGQEIKLWINDNFDYMDSYFEGVVVYGRTSKCVVSLEVNDK